MAAAEPSRVGLLGGSFDPPHLGHLRLARLACDNLRLDELRFVPCRASVHKSEPTAEKGARLAMLRQMILGTPFQIEGIELEPGSTGYTVDTLEALGGRDHGASWILVIGSDQAESFQSWREPERILSIASVAIAPRPPAGSTIAGCIAMPEILAARICSEWSGQPGQVVVLPSTELGYSSSRIREHLASGVHPDGLDERVMAAILQEQMYSLDERRLDGP